MSFKRISDTFTRPNDTTTYAAGDVVNNSTTTPEGLVFTNIVGGTNGKGKIAQATLTSSANQSTKGDFELWLFNTAPEVDNDNAAFTPTDAELANLVTIIGFTGSTAIVGGAGSGAAGNLVYFGVPKNGQKDAIIFTKTGSRVLYGVLVARNAYVPIAEEVFTITLSAE